MGLTRKEKMMIAVLLAGALLVVLNQTLLSPALPTIMSDLNVNATTVQWLTSGYALVEAIVIPLNAFFVGRFSTRRLFIAGIAWFTCGSIVSALSANFYLLLLGRVMQAMATGVVMPMVFTLILLIFPREKRGAAMGIVGLIISFAPAVGPSVSGILVDTVGWRLLFVVVACLAAAVVAFAVFSLENFGGFERARFDLLSVLLLFAGMFGLLYGLSTFTSSSMPVVCAACSLAGAILLGLFVLRQKKLEQPMLNMSVFSSRKFATAVGIIAVLEAVLIGSGVIFPIFIQDVLGCSATVSGFALLPGACVGAVMSLMAGRLFDARGIRGIAVAGSVVLVCAGTGLVLFSMGMPVALVTVGNALMIAGLQTLITPLNTWGVNSVDNKLIQHCNSVSSTANQVGASFGTALIVSLTGFAGAFSDSSDPVTLSFVGTHLAFVGICALLVIAALLILVLVRDKAADGQGDREQDDRFAGIAGVDRPFLVVDVMNPKPGFVTADASVRDAIKMMRKRNTSGVPIVGDDERVVGFISDGDILKYLSRQRSTIASDGSSFYTLVDQDDFWKRLSDLLALDVMRIATKRVISIEAGDDVEDAFKTLSERRIKKVPVLLDGKLAGTLSRGNIITGLENVEYLLSETEGAKA